jgi:hypothetical protein
VVQENQGSLVTAEHVWNPFYVNALVERSQGQVPAVITTSDGDSFAIVADSSDPGQMDLCGWNASGGMILDYPLTDDDDDSLTLTSVAVGSDGSFAALLCGDDEPDSSEILRYMPMAKWSARSVPMGFRLASPCRPTRISRRRASCSCRMAR